MDKIISSLNNDNGELLFGLGTSQIASLGRRLPFDKALKLFQTAFANGVGVIDTADSYGSGDSEYLTGKILEKIGANPFIITKAGFPYADFPGWMSPINQIGKRVKQKLKAKKNFNSEYIINSLNKSLKRLKKKQIGAFLLHELTEEDIKLTDCWETLSRIKKTGLSSFVGISSNVHNVVKEGIQSGQVSFVETLVQYDDKNSIEITKLCKSNKIPVVANEVFGTFHSGKYDVEKTVSEVNLLPGLSQIKPMQLLLGITYFESKVNCILNGTKNEEHLLQNIKSTDFFPAIEQNLMAIKKIISDNRKN